MHKVLRKASLSSRMNKDKNCNLLYQYSHMFCLLVCGHFQRIARLSVFYQIIGLRLCLEVDIQIISVLNLVLTLRLRVIPSRVLGHNPESHNLEGHYPERHNLEDPQPGRELTRRRFNPERTQPGKT